MDWTWAWTPIGTDASFGDNPLADWVRVLVVVAGMVLVCVIGRIMVEQKRREIPMPHAQVARFVSLAFADLYISLTEVAVMGTPATPRLLAGVIATLAGIYGVRGMRVKQRRNPPVR